METTLTNEGDKRALILRLKRVEGQLRGVQQLIEKDAPCESVAQQLSAARRALDKAFHEMVACLVESKLAEGGQPNAEAKELRELLARYG
jgi:DNA-binding FrmR family transcriptional regulator